MRQHFNFSSIFKNNTTDANLNNFINDQYSS